MATTENKIQDMLSTIDEKKQEVASLKGQQTQLMQQLAEEGCKTIEEAEDILLEEKDRIEELQDKLDEGMKKLEEEFQW